jgi:phosphoribosylamine--glycine ligase
LFVATAENKLNEITLSIDPRTATTVMLVAGGYPGDYSKGQEITKLQDVNDVLVFHAGTKNNGGKIVTNGGRVIAVTGFGNSIPEALEKSNKAAATIQWEGKNYRRDIGLDLMK